VLMPRCSSKWEKFLYVRMSSWHEGRSRSLAVGSTVSVASVASVCQSAQSLPVFAIRYAICMGKGSEGTREQVTRRAGMPLPGISLLKLPKMRAESASVSFQCSFQRPFQRPQFQSARPQSLSLPPSSSRSLPNPKPSPGLENVGRAQRPSTGRPEKQESATSLRSPTPRRTP
jgi:hypothetical protein